VLLLQGRVMTEPVAVWSGEFLLSGVILHCYMLDDGQRIIDADDFAALLKAWGEGAKLPSPAEAEAFGRWQHGGDLP
jgi:hypothetical protein